MVRLVEMESRMVVARGRGGGSVGSRCSVGPELPLGRTRRLELERSDGGTRVCVSFTPRVVRLKQGQAASFTLWLFKQFVLKKEEYSFKTG